MTEPTLDPARTPARTLVPADAPVVLSVRGLVRHIPITRGIVFQRTVGQVQALDGVDLDLRRGETLGVVGESGCGKSTLARLLTAIDRPTAGEVTVLGEPISRLRGRELRAARRHIKLVFQDPYTSLDPRMTVESIVAEPLRIHHDVAPRAEHRRMVRELLELVGLNPDHAGRYPHQFSGGQRQRIGIARALALRPEILVCDEPVSALDVSVQAQIINLFASLQRELGVAYVFIAHNLSVVEHIADRVAVMYLGKFVEQGPAEQIYCASRHPYTRALLSAAPDPFDARRGDRIRLVGDVPSPINPPSGCRFRTRCWQARPSCADGVPPLAAPDPAHPEQLVACHLPLAPEGERPEVSTPLAPDEEPGASVEPDASAEPAASAGTAGPAGTAVPAGTAGPSGPGTRGGTDGPAGSSGPGTRGGTDAHGGPGSRGGPAVR